MHGQTKVPSLPTGWGVSVVGNRIKAWWDGPGIPNELVHNVLAWLGTASGGAEQWLDGEPPLRIYIEVTRRDEEIPF